MKKFLNISLLLTLLLPFFISCDNHKTYAEMLDDEKNMINEFIKKEHIKVISQTEFMDNGEKTNVDKNEYVHLNNGVYMQIVDKGNTEIMAQNNNRVIVRFTEYEIKPSGDSNVSLSNVDIAPMVDEFRFTKTENTISGRFTKGYMYHAYGSSVPEGWLVPLQYVGDYAHVKLIIPSKQGQDNAIRKVLPYFYDIQKYQFNK